VWKIVENDVETGIVKKLQELVENRENKDEFVFLYHSISNHINSMTEEDGFRLRFASNGKLNAPKKDLFNLVQTNEQKKRSTELLSCVTYTVSFGPVLDLIKEAIGKSEAEEENMEKLAQLEKSIMENRAAVVSRKNLQFHYVRSGDGVVLDKVTDDSNGSFDRIGYERVCPHCGQRLSRAAGFAEELVIGLLGSPRAGKTSCLVALFSALHSGKYSKFTFGTDKLENDEKYNALVEETAWYDKGYKVKKTDTDASNIFNYSLVVNAGNAKRILTFIDIPGEFWQSGDTGINDSFYRLYAGIYENIDCIWFMISKAGLTYTALAQDSQQPLLDETAEERDIIEGARPENFAFNLQQLGHHLAAHKKSFPPIAVIITKPEAALHVAAEKNEVIRFSLVKFAEAGENRMRLESSQAELSRMLSRERNTLVVDDKELFSISHDVRAYLNFKSEQMLQALERNCGGMFFLSLSPYGAPAKDRPLDHKMIAKNAESTAAPTPYRELLPLVWSLAVTGAIKVRHTIKRVPRDIFGNVKRNAMTETKESLAFDFRRENTRDKDIKAALESIRKNLMGGGSGNYTKTQLDHRRR